MLFWEWKEILPLSNIQTAKLSLCLSCQSQGRSFYRNGQSPGKRITSKYEIEYVVEMNMYIWDLN